ncbi:MAG: hypothetical protein ACI9JL_004350 [Paracoccaceae bacterium]|jgi:hypothetical protein
MINRVSLRQVEDLLLDCDIGICRETHWHLPRDGVLKTALD